MHTDAAGQPVLSAATVKPEDVTHVEVGVKTEPTRGVTANLTLFNTEIRDYQANVVKNAFVLKNIDKILDCLTRGLDLNILARGYANCRANRSYRDEICRRTRAHHRRA